MGFNCIKIIPSSLEKTNPLVSMQMKVIDITSGGSAAKAFGLNVPINAESSQSCGSPQGATFKALQFVNGNSGASFKPQSFVLKPIDNTTKAFEFKQGNLNATFNLKSFKLKRMSDGSLQWKPSSEESGAASSEELHNALSTGNVVAHPDLRSLEVYALVGCRPVPQWAADIPDIHKNIPDAEHQTLFQALRFAQQVKRSPALAELVKEVAFTEFLNGVAPSSKSLKADSDFAASPREFFSSYFAELSAEYVSGSVPAGSGVPAFRPRTALVHTFVLPASAPGELDDCADKPKLGKGQRISLALNRLSSRWRCRAKLFREQWREDRTHREAEREAKRKIKVERRTLVLLEKQQQLAHLRSCRQEAAHQKAQEEYDLEQAAIQRDIDAKLAAQRRKLENLEHQVHLAKANRKVAAALKRSLTVGGKTKPTGTTNIDKAAKPEKVSPQISSKSSQNTSIFGPQKSLSTTGTSPDVPSESSHRLNKSAPVPHAPLMLVNGCLNHREIEENPWNIGVGAEVRSMLGKERPVLGLLSVPKQKSAAQMSKTPKTGTIAPGMSSSKCTLKSLSLAKSLSKSFKVGDAPLAPTLPSEPLFAAGTPEDSTTVLLKPGQKSPAAAQPSAPVPPKRVKTPFWKTEKYINFRKAFKKGEFMPSTDEVLAGLSKLRPLSASSKS